MYCIQSHGCGFRGREGFAGISRAVPLPLAVVWKIMATNVLLTTLGLGWICESCSQLMIPQHSGILPAKHKVFQIPLTLPNAHMAMGTSKSS